jgi:hypothetical protein
MSLKFQSFSIPVFIVAGTLSAAAATVTPSGTVYIDRGSGYQPVAGAVEAKPGDVVMAMAGGSATVTYNNGCQQSVDVGAVVVVSEVGPCAADVSPGVDYTLVIGGVAVAGGVAAAIALSGGDDKPASP